MSPQFVLAIAVIAIVVVFSIGAVRAGIRNMKAKPGYADRDELVALRGVIASALRAKGIPVLTMRSIASYEPPYRELLLMQIRLDSRRLPSAVPTPDEIAVVAPFVEQWLSGELPHLLSSQYDDEMRIPLQHYKARMQSQGLWPKASPRPA